jgi:hypothetical protein
MLSRQGNRHASEAGMAGRDPIQQLEMAFFNGYLSCQAQLLMFREWQLNRGESHPRESREGDDVVDFVRQK